MLARGPRLRAFTACVLALAFVSSACRGNIFKREYEYEEEIYLDVDGSATVNVNSSIAALVALRGADLDTDPRARLDRAKIRQFFTGDAAQVTRVSGSRRDGRRFVHVSLRAADVRRLPRMAALSWSTYRLDHKGEAIEFTQTVGASTGKFVGDVGWSGRELVAFRMHLPSAIEDNNSPRPVQRGNILEWEQPLTERLNGVPLAATVTMQQTSILYSTLLLFGATILAAALTFALVIWWIARRGREAEMLESRP